MEIKRQNKGTLNETQEKWLKNRVKNRKNKGL